MFFKKKKKNEAEIEEEIISMVNEGHESGELLASEATMIQNIFEFSDTDVKDIMVHRKNIVALDGQMTLHEAIEFINSNHFSRYPVFLDDLDNIIGIFHIKDALLFINNPEANEKKLVDLGEILGKAEFVPETHGINTLFAKMQSKKSHMIIVMDEYGQVSGLISMEDILEEIVGNIFDEHDEEEVLAERTSENSFKMDGTAPLKDVEELLGIKLSDNFETLSGFLIAEVGKIPEDGSTFDIETSGFRFHVKNVVSKVIDEVEITNISQGDIQE